MDIFHGNVIYSKSRDELAVLKNSYIVVENGIVEGIYPCIPEKFAGAVVTDFG